MDNKMETTVMGAGFRVEGKNGKENGNYYNGLYYIGTVMKIPSFIPS